MSRPRLIFNPALPLSWAPHSLSHESVMPSLPIPVSSNTHSQSIEKSFLSVGESDHAVLAVLESDLQRLFKDFQILCSSAWMHSNPLFNAASLVTSILPEDESNGIFESQESSMSSRMREGIIQAVREEVLDAIRGQPKVLGLEILALALGVRGEERKEGLWVLWDSTDLIGGVVSDEWRKWMMEVVETVAGLCNGSQPVNASRDSQLMSSAVVVLRSVCSHVKDVYKRLEENSSGALMAEEGEQEGVRRESVPSLLIPPRPRPAAVGWWHHVDNVLSQASVTPPSTWGAVFPSLAPVITDALIEDPSRLAALVTRLSVGALIHGPSVHALVITATSSLFGACPSDTMVELGDAFATACDALAVDEGRDPEGGPNSLLSATRSFLLPLRESHEPLLGSQTLIWAMFHRVKGVRGGQRLLVEIGASEKQALWTRDAALSLVTPLSGNPVTDEDEDGIKRGLLKGVLRGDRGMSTRAARVNATLALLRSSPGSPSSVSAAREAGLPPEQQMEEEDRTGLKASIVTRAQQLLSL